jgi:hypothetical protein
MLLDESLWNEPGWNQHVEHFPQPLAVDNLYAFYDTFEPPGVSPDTTLPVLTFNQSSPTNDSSASSTTQETNPNRKRLGEDSRKTLLAQDDYILSFTPKQVICSGCRKIIKLDGREHARYYTTFWYNHKARCLGVDVGIVSHDFPTFGGCAIDFNPPPDSGNTP